MAPGMGLGLSPALRACGSPVCSPGLPVLWDQKPKASEEGHCQRDFVQLQRGFCTGLKACVRRRAGDRGDLPSAGSRQGLRRGFPGLLVKTDRPGFPRESEPEGSCELGWVFTRLDRMLSTRAEAELSRKEGPDCLFPG